MQRLINEILERAKADRQRIVLPEGTEERTLKAANQILTDGIADLILLGNPAEINACATEWGLGNISKATIIDPENNPKQEEYAQLLFELRKKKGMTIEEARKLVTNPLYLGCHYQERRCRRSVGRCTQYYRRCASSGFADYQDCSGHYLRFRCYVVADACSRIW